MLRAAVSRLTRRLLESQPASFLDECVAILSEHRDARRTARRRAACPHAHCYWTSRPYPTRKTAAGNPLVNVALAGQADVRWVCDDCGATGQDMQPCDHPGHALEWYTRDGVVDGPVRTLPL